MIGISPPWGKLEYLFELDNISRLCKKHLKHPFMPVYLREKKFQIQSSDFMTYANSICPAPPSGGS